jgi:hypothetical protein
VPHTLRYVYLSFAQCVTPQHPPSPRACVQPMGKSTPIASQAQRNLTATAPHRVLARKYSRAQAQPHAPAYNAAARQRSRVAATTHTLHMRYAVYTNANTTHAVMSFFMKNSYIVSHCQQLVYWVACERVAYMRETTRAQMSCTAQAATQLNE